MSEAWRPQRHGDRRGMATAEAWRPQRHGDRRDMATAKKHGDRKGRHYYIRVRSLPRSSYSSGDPCGRHASAVAIPGYTYIYL